MNDNISNTGQNQSEEALNIKDILTLCLSKWYLFVISVAVCLAIAANKILKTPPTYTRTATVMIKENNTRRTSSSELEALMSGNMMSSINSKLSNEIYTFQSYSLMQEVVKRLYLNTQYQVDGRFHKNVIYGSQVPYVVTIPDNNVSASFTLTRQDDGNIRISDLVYNSKGEKYKVKDSYTAAAGDTVATAAGEVIVGLSDLYTGDFSQPVYVTHRSIKATADSYLRRLNVGAADTKNNADIVKISLQDLSVARAEDVINTLISIYNEKWVEDRNQIAISTTMFINDRLTNIEKELGNVDENISSYQSKNLIPDVAAASTMYMTQSSEIDKQIQVLDNQLYMARYIRNYLTNTVSNDQLIPASPGSLSNAVADQVRSYNETLLKRNNLVANSSEKNPLVIDLDESLSSMRGTIVASIDNEINSINSQIEKLQKTEKKTNTRIAESPTQAKYILTVERRQKVMESLYLYLLQKREENELGQAFTAYNTRVIDSPTGSSAPSSPNKNQILLIALLIGLMIPAAYLYIAEMLNTRVRGKSDLKKLSAPVIGEIPLKEGSKLSRAALKKLINDDKKKDEKINIVVKSGNRDVINEAFRVLRTNLEFMTKGKNSKVMAITSFNVGSGKSFVSANTCASLAIKGLDVLLIDGDLRHASASAIVNYPKRGFSDYLAERESDLDALIVKSPESEHFNVLPVGTIPPNPTELISSERFVKAIEELKPKFDYIFIDCPPVEMMADAQIIIDSCDRTLFVIRAGLFERGMLPELENAYKTERYKNMSLVLNGSMMSGKYGYGKGYGYHYGSKGYHYGYGKKATDTVAY